MENKIETRQYFPLGKANGLAFCNRASERAWLEGNIRANKHSLLSAPRRFGKSSLADTVVGLTGLPALCINFNTCTDEQDVEKLIREGASQLIGNALGSIEKLTHSIKKYLSHLTPKLILGTDYAHLELVSENQSSSSATNLEEALNLLEKLLAEKNQSAVMILDEFQVVGLIAKGSGVEAAIRNVAQNTHYLSFIFLGSNRSLLLSMFEDEARPLYKLCRKLHLKRIDSEHYQKHLNEVAVLQWKQPLDETVFEKIMSLSKRHPYYVNYLCDVIWTNCVILPTVLDIEKAWQQVIEEESSDANAELMNLAMGQKKILKFIANYQENSLMSSNTMQKTGMALSSTAGAIASLLEKDLIEKQDNYYQIINPIIEALLTI